MKTLRVRRIPSTYSADGESDSATVIPDNEGIVGIEFFEGEFFALTAEIEQSAVDVPDEQEAPTLNVPIIRGGN